jgi:hypothetical protein
VSLWSNGDVTYQERMNRDTIVSRLFGPIYDVDDAGTTITVDPFRLSYMLTSSLSTIHAIPASGVAVAQISTITITNFNASASRLVSLFLVEPGATLGSAARSIVNGMLLSAGETLTIRVPYFMAPGSSIRGNASSNGAISVRIDGIYYTAQPAGLTLVVSEGVALTTTPTAVYTTPASSLTHELILGVTLCNSHTANVRPQVFSGVATNANIIFHDVINPNESVWLTGMHHHEPGDAIIAAADVTNVMSARVTALRFI